MGFRLDRKYFDIPPDPHFVFNQDQNRFDRRNPGSKLQGFVNIGPGFHHVAKPGCSGVRESGVR